LNHVSQSSPIDSHTGLNGTSATPSVNIITITGNSWIIDTVSTKDGPLTPGGAQSEMWDFSQGSIRGAGSTQVTTSAGNYTMSWTNTVGSKEWTISAVAIRFSPPVILPSSEWSVASISPSNFDPQILNSGETAQITATLSFPVDQNGVVIVVLSSDNGVVATRSTVT